MFCVSEIIYRKIRRGKTSLEQQRFSYETFTSSQETYVWSLGVIALWKRLYVLDRLLQTFRVILAICSIVRSSFDLILQCCRYNILFWNLWSLREWQAGASGCGWMSWGGGGTCRGRQLHTTHECARSRRQDKGSFTRSAIHGPIYRIPATGIIGLVASVLGWP